MCVYEQIDILSQLIYLRPSTTRVTENAGGDDDDDDYEEVDGIRAGCWHGTGDVSPLLRILVV